ncbi:hypothetical protein [Treponema sp.]|uniref:hypothetical protein n=1 Tax=Treponema sp. TaxID=166 RepID=UPI00298E57E4|nr:hypothetical protein [Treponema sp.]MCR5614492.1 hypothetical protein [Treponema sp.]
MFETFINKITSRVLEVFSKRESNSEQKEHEFEGENFCVHAAKWVLPVGIIAVLLFGGFAYYCYINDVKIGMAFFIAFAVFGFIAVVIDTGFKLDIDGQQIAVRRFLRGIKYYTCREIISVRMDNAKKLKLELGTEKITIDSFMINKDHFFKFAQSWAFKNAQSRINVTYKISRDSSDFIILGLSVPVLIGVIFLCLRDFGNLDFLQKYIQLPIVALLVIVSIFYLIHILCKKIIVDENKSVVTYNKGLKKRSAGFEQIESIVTKDRFLEEKAFNYIMTVQRPDGKFDRVKFSSHDDNSDRLVNRIIQQFPEDSDA